MRHIHIKAASCLDMIDAFNQKIAELDPSYVESSCDTSCKEDVMAVENLDGTNWAPITDYIGIAKRAIDPELGDVQVDGENRLLLTWYGLDTYTVTNHPDEDGDCLLVRGANDDERILCFGADDLIEFCDSRNAMAANTKDEVTASNCGSDPKQYVQGADSTIDESYVDEMMQYVADETIVALDAVCTWRVEGDNLIFVISNAETDLIHEYTCPLTDLSGDIDLDTNYVLTSIDPDLVLDEDEDPIENDVPVDSSTQITASDDFADLKSKLASMNEDIQKVMFILDSAVEDSDEEVLYAANQMITILSKAINDSYDIWHRHFGIAIDGCTTCGCEEEN